MMTNVTLTNEIPICDTQGAIIYIFCVSVWYAIGFGLILINDIGPQTDHHKKQKYMNVYQAIHDLHEQKARNDILVELKDKDKRKKLWDIYRGNTNTDLLIIKKEDKTINSISKQLNELNEQRHLLQMALYGMSFDQPDGDETESSVSIQQNN
jgi:hypothetical protein